MCLATGLIKGYRTVALEHRQHFLTVLRHLFFLGHPRPLQVSSDKPPDFQGTSAALASSGAELPQRPASGWKTHQLPGGGTVSKVLCRADRSCAGWRAEAKSPS